MLTSLLGVRLILWMGKTVPLPAPYDVVSALTKVEVTNDAEQGDGFQITFTLGKDKTLDYGLLQSGALEPFTRVIVGVLLGVTPEPLIDGIITHHQFAPSGEPGVSTLTVTGKDVSLMLDLEEKNAKYENMPDFLIFTQLIAQYAQYGLVPVPTPTPDIPIMLFRIPRQHETDLKFIQRLAAKNGFVFYIEPLTFGVNTAYFGVEKRIGIPQPALSMNMGGSSNLKSLHFTYDSLAPISTKGKFIEPISKTSIPIPPLPSLRIPPLALNSATARRIRLLRESANQNPASAAATAVGQVTRAPEAVSGEGELETVHYGSILRARKLVGVRGAGLNYDGMYYVRRVTHSIARGSYTQKFTLSREGTGPLLPVVVP